MRLVAEKQRERRRTWLFCRRDRKGGDMADSQGLGWLEFKTPLRHAFRCLAVTYQSPSARRYGCSALRIQEGVRQGGASVDADAGQHLP